MKRFITVLSAFFVLLVGSCSTVPKPALKPLSETAFTDRPVIAVVDFRNKTGDPGYDNLMKGITGSMISELQGTKHFRIIERERLHAILDELKLNLGGLVNPDNAREVGKILGVDALLFGNLSSVKYSKNKQTIFIAWTEGQNVDVAQEKSLLLPKPPPL